ncbi:MAG: hypothetical protein EBT04_02345 [Betaproteobacteria bacterium]|nr:hypothetical protein [Betaproteobacteria bacterium]
MTLQQLLASPPESFSWPSAGLDGNAAPGLVPVGLAWGPRMAMLVGEDSPGQALFVAESPSQPWTCMYAALPPARSTALPAIPVSTTVVRPTPILRPPPARAAIMMRRR